ncbi:hypothetical protein N6L26_12100 [Qipengyuania sp. SS22]|uniref:hypothetical protein n=1 Tax=Qipengyuania sp. SS22 TaxID=2979461 RepID=UPI0021E5BEC1|nr:hypothetical protein [Qipengyuania sp. SS22]UYH54770.1 hypothetical protein N6L26_12100 [Qipengyuania sp. SS22]
MAAYVVTYDLRAPGRNYQGLYDRLRQYPRWAKVTESNWVVVTEWTASQIRDDLSGYIDTNDRLFVIKSGVEAAWKNSICENEWLRNNL